MAEFIPMYNLESLTEPQRAEYVRAVCKHMGVPDNLGLIQLTYVDDGEGPSRLVAYVKRGATENIRAVLGISIDSLESQMIGGSIVFTAIAKDSHNRREISTGSKFIDGLTGTALDDAIMTAQTRALRRVTLQFVGAGVLDESEVNQRKTIHVQSASIVPTPQPIVQPSSEPGKDVTPLPSLETVVQAMEKIAISEAFPPPLIGNLEDERKRLEAIAQLNAQVDTPVKKARKPRGPNKKKVDLGPSEPAATLSISEPEKIVPMTQQVIAPVAAPVAMTPPVANKPRLNLDQSKPFRQRHFKIVDTLEQEGKFEPREGMGNPDKMRMLAMLMFPEITNMNMLDEIQWEKYLTLLEGKIKSDGAVKTVKYIEDTIGI